MTRKDANEIGKWVFQRAHNCRRQMNATISAIEEMKAFYAIETGGVSNKPYEEVLEQAEHAVAILTDIEKFFDVDYEDEEDE